MEELHCNIVVMKGSQPKVLRLNLGCSDALQTPFFSAPSSPALDPGNLHGSRMKHSTPVSSSEEPSISYTRSSEENLSSSSDKVTSVFLVYEENPLFEGLVRGRHSPISKHNDLDDPLTALDSCLERIITLSVTPKSSATNNTNRVFWIPETQSVGEKSVVSRNSKSVPKTQITTIGNFNQDIMKAGPKPSQTYDRDLILRSSIKEAVSFGRTSSIPPPLCSLCKHQAPAFGKPPRRFDYRELQDATGGFSDRNFLAGGGFSLVHRGVLKDGIVVAVKQLKIAGSQGDADFCREVRVLSCAQHKNVVLLVGFCIDGNKRVLVYEYVCNDSLDVHLHGNKGTSLGWQSRLKIAIGTARGLRYLHEDCRVGCIVHRDMRPKNILLTHDFEPLVGDFGLVSLHAERDICDEERFTGTSGYLAPEYFNGGTISEKVDIYAFGLVLLELITGRRSSELQYYKDHNFLTENFHSLVDALEPVHLSAYKHQLLDPCLPSYQLDNLPHQLHAIGHAASLCLQKDPESRPPMSKVLKILEGGDATIPLSLDLNSAGSRSGHMQAVISNTQVESKRHSRRLSY